MFDRRLGLLYFIFCAALLCIGARLFQLQVLGLTSEDPDAVLRRPLPLEEIPAARGTLFDRDGTVLACDQPTLELTVQYGELLRMCALGGNSMFPEELDRIREAEKRRPVAADSLQARLEALSAATGCDRDQILARIGEIVNQVRRLRRQALGDHEAEFGRRTLYEETLPHVLISGVSIETAERAAADASRFPGVAVSAAWRRTYPQGKSAAHVVGYLGRAHAPSRGETPEDPDVRPGDRVGIAGAEKQFDSALRGVPGIVHTAADPKTGRLARDVLFGAQPGRNLYLSLSGPAQRQAEKALAGLVGAVVVMDLRTGELLVLASSPSFDPATGPAAEDLPMHPYLSRATQDSVAPGSVFKPVVALAAAAGGFGTERTFTCDGTLVYGGVTFHCEGHHGAVNMAQALAMSCNIYFFQVARQAGAHAILAWASALPRTPDRRGPAVRMGRPAAATAPRLAGGPDDEPGDRAGRPQRHAAANRGDDRRDRQRRQVPAPDDPPPDRACARGGRALAADALARAKSRFRRTGCAPCVRACASARSPAPRATCPDFAS